MYDWSDEQKTLFNTALETTATGEFVHPLIKVAAVAGAAKSSSLVGLAKRYPEGTTMTYLVFGNANAQEARESFGTLAKVSTLHALAYHYIFRKYSFPIRKDIAPFISWRDIPKDIKIPFGKTPLVTNLLSRFFESTELSLSEFASDDDDNKDLIKPAQQILEAMSQGKMRITHGMYLKLFHSLVMTDEIELEPTDVLFIDEFGDVTEQTFDIFMKYPAKQKIACGDVAQSVFKFMGCINGFDRLLNKGTTLSLSKSFRVSEAIAKRVEWFGKQYLEDDFVFKGMQYPDDYEIKTTAYITRNNSALIEKMIDLNLTGTEYRLITKAKTDQLFKLPLFLLSLKQGKVFKDQELKELQRTVDEFYEEDIQGTSVMQYVLVHNQDNKELSKAVNILKKYGAEDVINAKLNADKHKKSNANLILGTAFVFKGLTVDKVIISDELNKVVDNSINNINDNDFTEDDIVNLKLYYVACTRCRYELENAVHL